MKISRSLVLAAALSCGCSGRVEYVPLNQWPRSSSITSREVSTPSGVFRCQLGFEYEGPLEYQAIGGNFRTLIPQACRHVIPRQKDLLVVTLVEVDTLQGWETTVWSVNPNQNGNPALLILTKLQGYPVDFRRRPEGIEFELNHRDPTTSRCALVTNDNVVRTAPCGSNKLKVHMI